MSRLFIKTAPIFLASAALLVTLPAPASARELLERSEFALTGGYRVDRLDWNIAGDINGKNPDVLSELTWNDLKSHQLSARGKMILLNDQMPFGRVLRLGASYGEIYAGANQDSDYDGNGRTQEFSRSNNQADSGKVWDGSAGVGLVFFNQARTLALTPLVGYSLHAQNLTMTDGYQTVPGLGPFAGLHSTYETKWRSDWLGLDLDYIPSPYFDLHGGVEVHSGKYRADADWNLRSDLAHPRSFSHTSDSATGLVANIGVRTGGDNVFLTLDYSYQKWQAKDGVDRTYFLDGTVRDTKLNEVNWQASSINTGVTVRF